MPRSHTDPARGPDVPASGPSEHRRTERPVGRGDVAVAGATWLVAVAVLLSLPPLAELDPETALRGPDLGAGGWWLGVGVLSWQGVALLRRRHRPGVVLIAVAAGAPAGALVGLGDAVGATSVAILVAAYTLTVAGPLRRGLPALGGGVALMALGTLLSLPDDALPTALTVGGALLQAVATVGLAVLAGVVVGSRRDTAEARARQAAALSREHDARMQAAVARERTAMARELHDIAAHHLSGIAMMTGAIGRQIDTDPDAAKVAVQQVRGETTAMLTELRALVRLLRDVPTDEDGHDVRVETLRSVPTLVERAQAAGVEATLTVLGTADGRLPVDVVGPLAQVAAYRTVQECLANVVRHAPGARCEVVLDARDPATLVISVRNGPARDPAAPVTGADGGPAISQDGLGLIGMQERAELTDARLSYGREPDGGWLVRLELPAGGAVPSGPTEG